MDSKTPQVDQLIIATVASTTHGQSKRQAKERDSFLYEAQRQRSREIYNRIIDEGDNITIEDILEEFPEDHDRLEIYGYGPRSEEYFQYLLDTYYYPYHSKKPITYDYGYDR